MKINNQKQKPKHAAKYEMNLAEFPIAVLSKRIPSNKKTIEYSDWIVGKNGERKQRNWVVTAAAKWALPTGSALRTLFELMQVWKENNLESKTIPIGSRYNLLKRMGARDSKGDYKRIEKDLNSLVGITIQAKNAFWDKEAQAYVSKTFHLFEELSLYDREIKTTEGMIQQSLPFSYIKASDIFHEAVKKGNILTIDSEFFRKLSAPTEQRLALYLTKMLKRQPIHKRDIFKLAEQLPIYNKYASDIKKTLNKALKGLIDKNFPLLEKYYYEKSSNGKSENVVFLKPKQRPKQDREPEDYKVQSLVEDMLNTLRDEKSRAFYVKIAKLCPQDMIYRALSETKQDYSDSSIRKNRGAIFTEKIKRYAKETGINLGLLAPKRDSLTKTEKEGIKEMEKVFGGAVKFVDKDKNRDI